MKPSLYRSSAIFIICSGEMRNTLFRRFCISIVFGVRWPSLVFLPVDFNHSRRI